MGKFGTFVNLRYRHVLFRSKKPFDNILEILDDVIKIVSKKLQNTLLNYGK